MGTEGLFLTICIGVFGFIIGWMKGCEDEQSRIRDAFRSEDYTYSGFLDVLEKYEQEKEAAKHWAKHEKKKKRKNK
jgi:hypothetical protein|tara:strand:- start:684 stop:911 length:228 start_codon:yes stop_codon:yes gene_type:complete